MMTKALNKSAASYGVQAAGNVQTIPDVSLNSKTGAFVFTGSNKGMQSLNAIVDRYYGGDTNALINDGLRARDRIRDRLQLSPDTAAYNTFLASTEILDNSLWKGMVPQLNKVKNIPVRFKQFNDMANKLKVDLDVIPEVIGDDSTTVSTIGEAVKQGDLNRAVDVISQRDANIEVNAPELPEIQQEKLPTLGSESEPYKVEDEEQYNGIPAGSYYRVGNDPTLRIKRGSN